MASSSAVIGVNYWKGLWNQAWSVITKNTAFGSFSTGESLYDDFNEARDARLALMVRNDDEDEEVDDNDSTLPQNSRDWKRWVVVFVHAMVDMTKTEESTHAKNRFQNLWLREGEAGRAQIEIMAWDVLKHMQEYHAVGGPVDPSTDRKARRRRGEGAFEQHAHDVAAALLYYKTICHDVARRHDIQLFVDDVDKTTLRKKSYRSSNVGRATRNANMKDDSEELKKRKSSADHESASPKKRNSSADHERVSPKKRKSSAEQPKKVTKKIKRPLTAVSSSGFDSPQHSNSAPIAPAQPAYHQSYELLGNDTEVGTSFAGLNAALTYSSDAFSHSQPGMPPTGTFDTELTQSAYAFGYTENGYSPGERSVLPTAEDRPTFPVVHGGFSPVHNGRAIHVEYLGFPWSPEEHTQERSYEGFQTPETRNSLHDDEKTSEDPFEDSFETLVSHSLLQDRNFVSPSEDGGFFQSSEEHSAVNSVASNGLSENEYPDPPQVNDHNLAGSDAFEDYFVRKGVEVFGNQYGTNGDSAHYSFQNSYYVDNDDDQ